MSLFRLGVAMLIMADDQPVSATFFKEGKWLSNWITPNALEVKKLHQNLTEKIPRLEDRLLACWEWVANCRYKQFISARISVEDHVDYQEDFWQDPSLMIRTQVGNCSNKSFLLTSLLRNELTPEQVYCTLGNLHNGKPGGHAWVTVKIDGQEYVMEATRPDVQPLVKSSIATRYEPVHFFNDQVAMVDDEKTALEPFTRCYSTWLTDYLDWAYVEGRK